jgi:hypothetical protein
MSGPAAKWTQIWTQRTHFGNASRIVCGTALNDPVAMSSMRWSLGSALLMLFAFRHVLSTRGAAEAVPTRLVNRSELAAERNQTASRLVASVSR